jgi:predicted Zn-dependent peptidase
VASAVTQTGDWRYIEKERERLKAVTTEDVLRVLDKYLTAENRTTAVLLPEKADEPAEGEGP